MDIIFNQPNHRRVSNDRFYRVDSQFVLYEFSPTPARKIIPHSYPKTRFCRERAYAAVRVGRCIWSSKPTDGRGVYEEKSERI